MTIYQQLLKYFVNTERPNFYDAFQGFMVRYRYRGHCQTNEEYYCFETDLYRRCEERLNLENGFALHLSDEQIARYFSCDHDVDQLFAILFAHWYGLSDAQTEQVGSCSSGEQAWNVLHSFIPAGSAYIYPRDNPRDARRCTICGETVSVPDTGEVFEVIVI